MSLKVIYRGHLTDCNYSCEYCPFAKEKNSREMQALDRKDLDRFVAWVEQNSSAARPMEIFITPYGEALVRKWYQEAMIRLSHLPHVSKVAAQTNLAWNTQWLSRCNVQTTALWTTYHPDFVSEDKFAGKCEELRAMQIRHSVGVVGLQQHFAKIASLRQRLPDSTYMWVNAYKREANYYTDQDISFLEGIDHLFRLNLPWYESMGKPCKAGDEIVSIEGNGDLFRCHFIKTRKGNIFTDPLDSMLKKEVCTKATCHCHIGYIHLDHMKSEQVYGSGLLERIPVKYGNAHRFG
ncbi:STM4011 family radical SAM protein [Undibacterium sp. TS12]|uniref:STM4011 family radical SAM protein n=1 Tax=Undibacterium sp. TS12 TaxID=2908202 RepID=UPI001F4D0B62|nr:STM4011 family radical SAM protein [Undibacterium sp. TS12]MCH8621213.1 STM4011 family radical SAM protein [Undibacterium sp. TS12]